MAKTTHRFTATDADAKMRLDRFLSARLPELSRSRLQALIGQGCVTSSSGHVIGDTAAKVKAGQEFTLTIPETAPSHILPQAIALDIIYEDDDLLVINKSPGLTVHPGAGNPDHTLVNALLAHCGASLSGIGGVARPGIVHRIDKDTSGLLVVAKNDAAHNALSAQLADRSLKRTYAAIVWGLPKNSHGTITGNIGRSISNRQKMAVVQKSGKPAVTHYEVVKEFPLTLPLFRMREREAPRMCGAGEGSLASLVECKLETGRTHQIRVHFAHIGHPLVGDPVYGQSTQSRLNANIYKSLPEKTRAMLLGFKRQALHARALELIHPATGKKMCFEAEIPADMRMLIETLAS